MLSVKKVKEKLNGKTATALLNERSNPTYNKETNYGNQFYCLVKLRSYENQVSEFTGYGIPNLIHSKLEFPTQKRNSKKAAKEDAAVNALCTRHELLKNEEDFFVKRSDGSLVSPIIVVNEKFNTSAQYEGTIKNQKDCIFQTLLKINGVVKATGLGYNAKISKIQAAYQFCVRNENTAVFQAVRNDNGDSTRYVGMAGLQESALRSGIEIKHQTEHQTDNNSGNGSYNKMNQMIVGPIDVPKYNKDSYSITGKKVCLVLVISKFDKSENDRKYTENDYQQASEVLKRRGFEVILMVGRVTKNEFTKKLKEIRNRRDIGLFMLVVSSHGDENDNVMFSDNSNWNNGKPRNSKMISLIKGPILENPNLKKVPKVLVLQHCRGEDHIDLDSSSDSECETDGALNERSHRMNDTVIFWSTSEGNPAVRSQNGSVYLQYFFKCLSGLTKTDDIYDLQRWLNQCLMGKSYKVSIQNQKMRIMICPSMQTTLQKRLHL